MIDERQAQDLKTAGHVVKAMGLAARPINPNDEELGFFVATPHTSGLVDPDMLYVDGATGIYVAVTPSPYHGVIVGWYPDEEALEENAPHGRSDDVSPDEVMDIIKGLYPEDSECVCNEAPCWHPACTEHDPLLHGRIVDVLCDDWSRWADEEGGPEGAATRIMALLEEGR